jgi:hypothetical protein
MALSNHTKNLLLSALGSIEAANEISAMGDEELTSTDANTASAVVQRDSSGGFSAGVVSATRLDVTAPATDSVVGVVAAPAAGTVAVTIKRVGDMFTLVFTLTAAQISVTDGAASGSYGSLKLFDFAEQGISYLGCRQNYTAYVEGAALTTAAGDADFVIGVGATAIAAAADAVLAVGNQNIGGSIAQTNSAGTTTGTLHSGSNTAIDGTSTASDIYLNFSGSAATIDASSTIAVTGTIQITGVMLGDD